LFQIVTKKLQAHTWLRDSEREQLCRLMNCQKVSLEASFYVAQNERLPLRVIVQVLFFEQLRLRTSISRWFLFLKILTTHKIQVEILVFQRVLKRIPQDSRKHEERLLELEKECWCIRKELQKLTKTKKSWSIFPKRFRFRKKSRIIPVLMNQIM
jgi:hypothetical protein